MVVAGVTQKSIEQIYQKKTQLEHILLRPDSYVGSVEATEYRQIWLLNAAGDQMERRTISVVPALYKIFDEIVVNAADNKQRDPENMDTIKVDINREAGEVSVYNNGRAIPVQIHSEHNCYVPELIFGHLLTSSNYDDDQKKTTGGRNGYGAKLTNIYSSTFVVETNDCLSGKYFKQVFKNNMSEKGEPTVKKALTLSDWTRITFRPDFAKFGMTGFDNDIYDLMVKRVYDLAGCTDKSVKVYLNGTKLKIRNFKDYVDMYLPDGTDTKRVFDDSSDRWQICVAVSEGTFEQVSFVNSIWTIKGGKHVDYITDQITKGALATIMKKKGAPKSLKPSHIKNHIFIFVNALIENPAFDSQTKENLTSNTKTFGSKCDISEALLKKILDVGIRDAVLSWSKFRETKDLKKNDGSKKSKILGIPKLDDANWAGTKNSQQCTLILTEGDSAKALAVSGLSIIGRDKYGVFPLKGKLLNVREATGAQILKNEEISNIKKILGLQQGVNYTDTSKLRYGHLMIMTDQDQDGSHIKGLLINFLHTFWPSLLKMNTFLSQFITPIVKVTKGNRSISFFTIPQYQEWRLQHPAGWKIKYFKGLGTSTSKDAKDYFSAIDKHQVWFKWDPSIDGKLNDDAIEKAFSKKRVDDRKSWLANVEDGTFIDYRRGHVSYQEFVDRELVLFSQSDNVRSIPSLLDGLKPGQRKIVYGCFKRKLTGEIKVAQLAGYVAEHSAYHHGEQSLTATIISLAQNYCGSNNINLLLPNGQFGTRHCLGKDAASPRYIFTGLSPVTRTLFPEQDDPLLHYLDDDGMKIEPKHYVPIIPMVLVNGAEGIGTGWSTSIPQYNPRDLVAWVKSKIADSPNRPVLIPWYKNFLGRICPIESNTTARKYEMTGIVQKHDRFFSILEIPVNKSTDSYKAMLEEKDEKKEILGFQARHTDIRVDFTVDVGDGNDCPLSGATEAEIIKKFKLSNTIATSNMILFDAEGQIKHYHTVEQILEDHFVVRSDMYVLRKEHLMSVLQRQCKRLDNKARFILGCIREEIHIRNVARARLEDMLEKQGFDRLPGPSYDTKMIILKHNTRLDDGNEEADALNATYDYLLNMPLLSLTKEKVEELVTELENKRKEIEVLEKTTPQDMWLADLDNFLKVLDAHESAEEAEQAQADAELAKKTKRPSPHTALIAAAKARKLTYQPAASCSINSDERTEDVPIHQNPSDSENMQSNSVPAIKPKPRALSSRQIVKSAQLKPSSDEIISDAFSDIEVLSARNPEVKRRTQTGATLSSSKLEAIAGSDDDSDESDDLVIIKSQTKKLSLSERLAQKPNAIAPKRLMSSTVVPPPVQKRSRPSSSSDSKSDPFVIDESEFLSKTAASSKSTSSKPSSRSKSSSKAAPSKPVSSKNTSKSTKVKKRAISDEEDGDIVILEDGKGSDSDSIPIAPRQRRSTKSKAVYVIDSDESDRNNDDDFEEISDEDDEDF